MRHYGGKKMSSTERRVMEEAKRERERQRVYEAQIVNDCVTELRMSAITDSQIENWLRSKGITIDATVKRIAHNVRVSYSH